MCAAAKIPAAENSAAQPSIARILAVVNQKGGVGKTTTALNLAACLGLAGVPTLLVDVDPQANATSGLGVPRNDGKPTTYEVLLGQVSVADAVQPTSVEHLSLLAGTRNMIGANLELVGADRREYKLRHALEPAREQYRFIVLDCPPALDLLTLNALVAADGLIVPMQAEYFALEGISELMTTIDSVAATFNPALGLEGVVLTMYDDRTNLSQQVAANLENFFGDKLFRTTVPRNIRLAEAPSHGLPVAVYDPRSRGAEAYTNLAAELLVRNGVVAPARHVESGQAPEHLTDDDSPSPPPPTAALETSPARKRGIWPFRS